MSKKSYSKNNKSVRKPSILVTDARIGSSSNINQNLLKSNLATTNLNQELSLDNDSGSTLDKNTLNDEINDLNSQSPVDDISETNVEQNLNFDTTQNNQNQNNESGNEDQIKIHDNPIVSLEPSADSSKNFIQFEFPQPGARKPRFSKNFNSRSRRSKQKLINNNLQGGKFQNISLDRILLGVSDIPSARARVPYGNVAMPPAGNQYLSNSNMQPFNNFHGQSNILNQQGFAHGVRSQRFQNSLINQNQKSRLNLPGIPSGVQIPMDGSNIYSPSLYSNLSNPLNKSRRPSTPSLAPKSRASNVAAYYLSGGLIGKPGLTNGAHLRATYKVAPQANLQGRTSKVSQKLVYLPDTNASEPTNPDNLSVLEEENDEDDDDEYFEDDDNLTDDESFGRNFKTSFDDERDINPESYHKRRKRNQKDIEYKERSIYNDEGTEYAMKDWLDPDFDQGLSNLEPYAYEQPHYSSSDVSHNHRSQFDPSGCEPEYDKHDDDMSPMWDDEEMQRKIAHEYKTDSNYLKNEMHNQNDISNNSDPRFPNNAQNKPVRQRSTRRRPDPTRNQLYSRTNAEKLSKESRSEKLPRVTAYCTADGFRLPETSEFLRARHNVAPKMYDEALYVPYTLPLLPGIAGCRVRSLTSLWKGGIRNSILENTSQLLKGDNKNESSNHTIGNHGEEFQNRDFNLNDHAELFIFSYGVIVFWNFSKNQEKEILADLTFARWNSGKHTKRKTNTALAHSSLIESTSQKISDNTCLNINKNNDYNYGTLSSIIFRKNRGERQNNMTLPSMENENKQTNKSERQSGLNCKSSIHKQKDESNGTIDTGISLVVRPINDSDFETEEFNFEYLRTIKRPRIYNDMITLRSDDHMTKLAMSHAIAQSTKLCRFEARMGSTMSEVQHIPRMLALTGALGMGREQVLKISGKLFKLRVDVNLSSNVLDTPDFFWEAEPMLHPLYSAVREYLEIEPRILVLNDRCKVFLELIDIIQESIAESNMSWITWIIILLIVLSLVIEGIEIALRFSILRK